MLFRSGHPSTTNYHHGRVGPLRGSSSRACQTQQTLAPWRLVAPTLLQRRLGILINPSPRARGGHPVELGTQQGHVAPSRLGQPAWRHSTHDPSTRASGPQQTSSLTPCMAPSSASFSCHRVRKVQLPALRFALFEAPPCAFRHDMLSSAKLIRVGCWAETNVVLPFAILCLHDRP